jgi:hypothetical protein
MAEKGETTSKDTKQTCMTKFFTRLDGKPSHEYLFEKEEADRKARIQAVCPRPIFTYPAGEGKNEGVGESREEENERRRTGTTTQDTRAT